MPRYMQRITEDSSNSNGRRLLVDSSWTKSTNLLSSYEFHQPTGIYFIERYCLFTLWKNNIIIGKIKLSPLSFATRWSWELFTIFWSTITKQRRMPNAWIWSLGGSITCVRMDTFLKSSNRSTFASSDNWRFHICPHEWSKTTSIWFSWWLLFYNATVSAWCLFD